MKPLRAFAAIALSLLLVGMQVGALVHAFDHDGARLARPHGAALLVPGADEVCSICTSFAGGAHAALGADEALPIQRATRSRIAGRFVSFAGAPPAYYRTRAPPHDPSTFV